MMQNPSRRMQRLVTAGLLPERAGQPVKVVAHISLADLLMLEGSSALLEEWTEQLRARWAGHRAGASARGSIGGAWPAMADAAKAVACDAAMAPYITGDVNPDALEDLFGCACSWTGSATTPAPARTTPAPTSGSIRQDSADPSGGVGGRDASGADTTQAGKPSSARSSAKLSTYCRARAGWCRSCGAGSSVSGWVARACRWTSATARRSRQGSAAR